MLARKLRPFLLSLSVVAACHGGLIADEHVGVNHSAETNSPSPANIPLPAADRDQCKKAASAPFAGGPAVSLGWSLAEGSTSADHRKRTGPLRPSLLAALTDANRASDDIQVSRVPLAPVRAANGKPTLSGAPVATPQNPVSVAFIAGDARSRAASGKPDTRLSVLSSSRPVASATQVLPRSAKSSNAETTLPASAHNIASGAAHRITSRDSTAQPVTSTPAVAAPGVTLPEPAPLAVPIQTTASNAAPIPAAGSGKGLGTRAARVARHAPASASTASTTPVTMPAASTGHGKPTLPAPVNSQVAQVSWSAARRPNAGKLPGTDHNFEADCVPFVAWNPAAPGELLPESALNGLPLGACSDLNKSFARSPRSVSDAEAGEVASAETPAAASSARSRTVVKPAVPETAAARTDVSPTVQPPIMQPDAATSAGRSRLTALKTGGSVNVHPADLAALRQLRPESQLEPYSAQHYLADLNALVEGNSDWLFVNPELLDLAPHEGPAEVPGYLQELHALAEPRPASVSSSTPRTVTVPAAVARMTQAERDRYQVQAAAPCETPGGQSLSDLFQPLTQIEAGGQSSSPPELPKNHKPGDSTELRRPDNRACAYMDTTTPLCYFTPTRYGAVRPSRNTHMLYTNPLYYEDPNLERCGIGHGCLTTAVSAMHFGTAIAFTPYMTLRTCPATCVPTLPDCPACHEFDEWICPAGGQ